MRLLFTGGGRSIGSNLANSAVVNDAAVELIDGLSTGNFENIQDLDLTSVAVSISDVDAHGVREALGRVDAVSDRAVLGSARKSIQEPMAIHASTAMRTLKAPPTLDTRVGHVAFEPDRWAVVLCIPRSFVLSDLG